MAEEQDKAGVQAILSKYQRHLYLKTADEKLRDEVIARLAAHQTQIFNCRTAFSLFGFDLATDDIWNKVGNFIGWKNYRAALQEARLAAGTPEAMEAFEKEKVRAEALAKAEADAEIAARSATTSSDGHHDIFGKSSATVVDKDQANFSGTNDVSIGTGFVGPVLASSETANPDGNSEAEIKGDQVQLSGAEASATSDASNRPGALASAKVDIAKSSVREMVISQLMLAGEKGLRASKIRTVYEANFNTKLHEKTVGMTLYRLSQDGLVRREGRDWFYVPPQGETKNPGVSAPGSIKVE